MRTGTRVPLSFIALFNTPRAKWQGLTSSTLVSSDFFTYKGGSQVRKHRPAHPVIPAEARMRARVSRGNTAMQ